MDTVIVPRFRESVGTLNLIPSVRLPDEKELSYNYHKFIPCDETFRSVPKKLQA